MSFQEPAKWRHEALEITSSTNTACLEIAKNGDPGNIWITAKRQTAARGSRGRAWQAGDNNLSASALLRFPAGTTGLHELTFVASLAIRDAVYALHGAALSDVRLKWPNDVLINGRKLSGILLESHDLKQARYVIIGIGVNVEEYPTDTIHPATSLKAEGITVTANVLFTHLSGSLVERLQQWNMSAGFASIREDWLRAAAGLNNAVEIRFPGTPNGVPLRGTFRGLDENGLMLVETTGQCIRKISVADIFISL